MDNFKGFVYNNRGPIIGILVAIIILCTQLYKIVLGMAVIAICAFIGKYVQENKTEVKEKLKKIIDKL